MQAWKVFYSYSHADADLRQKLSTYLAPLKRQGKIEEWSDRKIEPGANWDKEISANLDSAHLVLLLLSADFLASDYCFGVEVETALSRLKKGEVRVIPILLRACLWKQSPFSELQLIPQDAKPIKSALWPSEDEAFTAVADEIAELVTGPPPSSSAPVRSDQGQGLELSLRLVRGQVRSYARMYERTRQRMSASSERTQRMEEIFVKMRTLAVSSYPLLNEFVASPSPGERLAAVAILQVFAAREYLSFLVELVGSGKPFAGYHAIKALRFAVGSLDTSCYSELMDAIHNARELLRSAGIGFDTGRETELRTAEQELEAAMRSLSESSP
jgi:hypothetical protein